MFKLKIEENETVKNYTVMGTFNDNMLINLEEFIADMYNIEPEKQNIHPILFKSHKKDNYSKLSIVLTTLSRAVLNI